MAENPPEIKVGSYVEVVGTSNAQLNGTKGKIVEWRPDKERWAVHLNVGVKNLLPKNLKPAVKEEEVDYSKTPTTGNKVYVSYLHRKTTEDDLLKLFSACGIIAKIPQKDHKGAPDGFPDEWPHAIKMYKPGRDRGDALVEYQDPFAAAAAVKQLHQKEVHGKKIRVEFASASYKKSSGGGDRDRDHRSRPY